MIPDGAGFAHGVELHMRDQGLTSEIKVALLGPRTPHGHVPQRDFALSTPFLVQHLRPHFPKLREIRIVSTGYTSEYFDDLDPWATRPNECSVHLDVDPNNGIPAVPTGIIRRTKYGHNSLFGFAIWPKESAGFTTEFRVHAICPVSDAKRRWISINAHQGGMQVDVDPSITAVLDLCLKHASGPRDFAAIDLICDSPLWTLADVRYLLEGLSSRVGGGKVERFRTFTPQPYQHDALRGMLTSTCIADLGITELDLAPVDQPAELDPDWYMTVGSLVELLDALPACLESLSVSCIALEQLPRWPVLCRTTGPNLRTLRIRLSGDLRTSDVINNAYLMSRYATPGCQIWTSRCIGSKSPGFQERAWDESDDEDEYDSDEDDYSDSENEHAGGVGSGDGSEDASQDRSEDGSEHDSGGSESGACEDEPQKAGKRLGNLDWTYSMAMLKRLVLHTVNSPPPSKYSAADATARSNTTPLSSMGWISVSWAWCHHRLSSNSASCLIRRSGREWTSCEDMSCRPSGAAQGSDVAYLINVRHASSAV